KTSRGGLTQGQLVKQLGLGDEAPRDFQLLIYFFGARDGEVTGVPDVQPSIVGLWYPAQVMSDGEIRKTQIVIGGEPPATIKRTDPTHLDDDELAAARARIVATLDEIRA